MIKGDNTLEKQELRNDPMKVPEGYFDTLSIRVAERVAAGGRANGRKVTIKWSPVLAAACVTVFFIVGALLLRPETVATEQLAQDDDARMMDYLGISSAEVAELGTRADEGEISSQAIIDYMTCCGASGAYIYSQLADAE